MKAEKKYKRTAPLYAVVSILIFCGFVYLLSAIFGLGTPEHPAPSDPQAAAAAEAARRVEIDPLNPVVLAKKVDYSNSQEAAWHPRGEAPMLAELVKEGKLPPVGERIGPDPMVVEGVDGIGRYGGTLSLGSTSMVQDPGPRWRFVGFVRWSPEGPPMVPFLAKSWEVSEDKRTYTFHLREGLRWSDGHPFTTDDIIFAYQIDMGVLKYYKWLKAGKTPPAPDLPCGLKVDTRVEALDAHTIRFTFSEPNGLFPYQLGTYLAVRFFRSPKHYLSQFYAENLEEDLRPYSELGIHTMADLIRHLVPPDHWLWNYYQNHADELASYGDPELIHRLTREKKLPNTKALYGFVKRFNNPELPSMSPWICRHQTTTPPFEYVRNPYYPVVDAEGNQLPYTDRLFVDVKDARMLDVAVAQGSFAFHPFVDGYVDYTYITGQQKSSGYQVRHWYSGDSTKFTIQFNQNIRGPEGETEWKNKHELFNDVRFRRAMSVAINRQSIIDALYSGIGEPAQNMPRKESLFYDKESLTRWAQYDPQLANRLLDEAGYTHRDAEGFRTFKDGSKMMVVFTILDPLWEGMAHFVVKDWEAVGVRCMLSLRSRTMFDMLMQQQSYDIYTWGGNDEYFPLIDPRYFVPGGQSGYAPAYAQWYNLLNRGRAPEEILALNMQTIQQPPPGGTFDRVARIYDRAAQETDLETQAEIFREAVRLVSDQVWAIGVVASPPTLAVVQNGLRNVPRKLVSAWDFLTPFNAYPETFFFEHPADPPTVFSGLKEQLVNPEYDSADARIEFSPEPKEGGVLGALLAWGFALTGILFVVHACLRRPYIAHRLLLMVPTLLILSVCVFTMIQLPEGDYISNKIAAMEMQGQSVDPEDIKLIKDMFYLNDSQAVRYMRWMGLKWFVTYDQQDKGLLQGFMGYSMQTLRPVNSMIGDRLALTMTISALTILVVWIVSLPLGVYCAVRQYSLTDYLLTFIGFLGMCIPNFVLALMVIYLADTQFGIKVSGLFSPEFAADPAWSAAKFIDLLKHIWVPVLVSAAAGTGASIRSTRANLLDELRKPYVKTALARGTHPLKVLIKYPFRMTLNPFISGIGFVFPMLVSGGALIAIVLSLPTVGPLLLDAVMVQDMYMAGSMMMLFTLLGMIGTLVSDLLLLVLDPRIRYTGGSR